MGEFLAAGFVYDEFATYHLHLVMPDVWQCHSTQEQTPELMSIRGLVFSDLVSLIFQIAQGQFVNTDPSPWHLRGDLLRMGSHSSRPCRCREPFRHRLPFSTSLDWGVGYVIIRRHNKIYILQ